MQNFKFKQIILHCALSILHYYTRAWRNWQQQTRTPPMADAERDLLAQRSKRTEEKGGAPEGSFGLPQESRGARQLHLG